MIIQVEYDDDGKILSVAGPASFELSDASGGMSGRIPRPGHSVAEVDTDEVHHDRDFEGLRKIIEGYRVTSHSRKPRLVHR